MIWLTVVLMAISLAMDALAVSVSNGMCYSNIGYKKALLMGLYFGGFQFMMPLLGYLLGQGVHTYIAPIDHWIVFVLLGYIGCAMIVEAFKKKQEDTCVLLTHKRLIIQAIATSIDALAAGVSLAFVEQNILISAGIIGIVAFLFSVTGALMGKRLGDIFQKRAQIIGGLVLIGIGIKTLLEHLFA